MKMFEGQLSVLSLNVDGDCLTINVQHGKAVSAD